MKFKWMFPVFIILETKIRFQSKRIYYSMLWQLARNFKDPTIPLKILLFKGHHLHRNNFTVHPYVVTKPNRTFRKLKCPPNLAFLCWNVELSPKSFFGRKKRKHVAKTEFICWLVRYFDRVVSFTKVVITFRTLFQDQWSRTYFILLWLNINLYLTNEYYTFHQHEFFPVPGQRKCYGA